MMHAPVPLHKKIDPASLDERNYTQSLLEAAQRAGLADEAFLRRVREELLAGKLQRVYHDIASSESASHCYVQRMADAVPQAFRARIHAMHLDSDCADALRALGFTVVEVAV